MTLLVTSFHVGITVYNLVVSKWIKDNMMQHMGRTDDATINTLRRFSNRFFTNWTFTLLTLFFIFCIFEDILQMVKGLESVKKQTRKLKNYWFTILVAPTTMYVTIVFWALWFINRELIFPKVIDEVLPSWMNHALHTTTSAIILAEMCLNSYQYPPFKHALLGISGYLLVYFICIVGTYLQSGVWLYPIFNIVDWPVRIGLFLGLYSFALALYTVQQFCMSLCWGETKKPNKPAKKKSKKH